MIIWGLRCFPSMGERSAVMVLAGSSPEEIREVGRLVLDEGEIEDLRARLAERQSVDTSDVSVMATEYTVCALPPEHRDYRYFAIKVELAGDRWMVTDGFQPPSCLGTDGTWSYRDGTDEWWEAHRFDLDTALRLAREEAPRVAAGVLSRAERAR